MKSDEEIKRCKRFTKRYSKIVEENKYLKEELSKLKKERISEYKRGFTDGTLKEIGITKQQLFEQDIDFLKKMESIKKFMEEEIESIKSSIKDRLIGKQSEVKK